MAGRSSADGEGFAGLALRLRGRTGLTQRDIAASLGVHVRSVQLWEAAASHPNASRLQALIRVFLQAGGFDLGSEAEEAQALWLAAMAESPRLNATFDGTWFERLLVDQTAPAEPPSLPRAGSLARQQWGEAPDVVGFLSRKHELEALRGWIVDDSCRLVAVLGMGGIGKSVLAARLAHDLAPFFQSVYWRSLHNAPNFSEWLTGAIVFLSPQDPVLTASEDARVSRLVELLSEAPCLVVLDNFETVLQPGEHTGGYVPGYEAYGRLIRRLAETPHRSCLLLTSREEPPEIGTYKGVAGSTRALSLGGLSVDDARILLGDKGLYGAAAAWDSLVGRYTGNGLALKMIGESIHELFGGDIAAYLEDVASAQGALFGGVRQLLETQTRRLSALEQRLMRRLAVEREPVSFAEIASYMGDGVARGDVREAVQALLRRSLLERREPGATFTLQPVVLEFVTEQFVTDAAREIETANLDHIRAQPLLNATARDYVRHTQERLIALPVLDRLIALVGSRQMAEDRLVALLDQFRARPPDQHGYGPGNVVNLLRLLRGDLRRVDLSRLVVRQAYLPDIEAQDASFAGAHLSDSVLAEAFHQISVALSPDGAHLVAGTTTGEICLWRAADRTLLLSIPGHAGLVWRVALSTEHGLIASASEDGTVKLWEAGSGRPLATFEGHTDFVQAVAISGDGGLVASGSQDGSVKLWRAPTGELVRTLDSPGGGVLSVDLSRDGSLVVCGTQDGTLAFWDAATGRLLGSPRGHTGPVPGLALSTDGRLLASGSLDGTACVWDVAARRLRHVVEGHGAGVWDVALDQEGKVLATASRDGSVHLWSAPDGQPLSTLLGHTSDVWDVSLSADGDRLASAGQDGTVLLSDVRAGRVLTALRGHTTAVWDVALSNDGRLAVTGSQDGIITIWDTSTGACRSRLVGHLASVDGIALSDDLRVLASASQDGSVRVWDPQSGELRHSLYGHAAGTVWDVAVSSDGQRVASASFDGTVKVWDAQGGELVRTLRGHTRGVRGVALNDPSGLLVSGSQDGSVKVWNVSDGRLISTLFGHAGSVQSVAFNGDGRLVASAGFDGAVRLWDPEGGTCLQILRAHQGGVLTVALGLDGRTVVSGGFDRTVRVWDAGSGRLLKTLADHRGAVWGVALSADSRVLVSGSFDGTTRLWDVRSGACLRAFQVDRPYERMDITGLTGVTRPNRAALAALGAVDRQATHVSR